MRDRLEAGPCMHFTLLPVVLVLSSGILLSCGSVPSNLAASSSCQRARQELSALDPPETFAAVPQYNDSALAILRRFEGELMRSEGEEVARLAGSAGSIVVTMETISMAVRAGQPEREVYEEISGLDEAIEEFEAVASNIGADECAPLFGSS